MGQYFADGLRDTGLRLTLAKTYNPSYWDYANKATCIAAASNWTQKLEEREQEENNGAAARPLGLGVLWIPEEWFVTNNTGYRQLPSACHFCKQADHLAINCRKESLHLLVVDWARQPRGQDYNTYIELYDHYQKRLQYSVAEQQLRTLEHWERG
jgi:hypothetical protein